MALAYPQINGNRYSFSSIEMDLLGLTFKGFTAISYTQALEPGEIRGNSPQLLGLTMGELKVSGNIDLFEEEDALLIQTMGDGFLTQTFPITVTFADIQADTRSDVIVGARFKGGARSFQKGTDGLVIKRDFIGFYIIENGIMPIPNLLQ